MAMFGPPGWRGERMARVGPWRDHSWQSFGPDRLAAASGWRWWARGG
ncbi:MAG: hypothetical protein QOI56_192, partial [Actinomycetota bacterium]|nr:hypothetical protein [Actinomycetota bacterium]